MRKLKTQYTEKEPVTITEEQAKARYNLGTNTLNKLGREAEAIVHYGRKKLFLVKRLDEYMELLAG